MSKDHLHEEPTATEREILSLLRKIQSSISPDEDMDEEDNKDPFEADTPPTPHAPSTKVVELPTLFPLIKDETEPVVKDEPLVKPMVTPAAALVESPEGRPKPPKDPNSLGARFLRALFPVKGDSAAEVVRKCIFSLSLLVFLTSVGFLSYYMVFEPQQVNSENEYYESLYNDTDGNSEGKDAYDYPAGMLPSFRQLYDVNKDVSGWLSYVSTDGDSFLNVSLPVVHCDNNDTYLSRSFDGKKSRSGTLFLDASNAVEQNVTNKVSIIYGHNMANGTMFASLNKLIGNVHRARSAPQLTFSTLYESHKYQVFAVVLSDEDASPENRFGYLRTSFADESDFMTYVSELRARSLFDYPVSVNADDELLILSTCTNKNQVKFGNGRLAVIARRVREGEDTSVDTTRIVKNEDVIMPYAWYVNQDLTPHAFYTQGDYHLPEDSTASTATTTVTTANGTSATSAGTTVTTDGTTVTTNGTTIGTTTDTTANTTLTTVTTTTTETAATTDKNALL